MFNQTKTPNSINQILNSVNMRYFSVFVVIIFVNLKVENPKTTGFRILRQSHCVAKIHCCCCLFIFSGICSQSLSFYAKSFNPPKLTFRSLLAASASQFIKIPRLLFQYSHIIKLSLFAVLSVYLMWDKHK